MESKRTKKIIIITAIVLAILLIAVLATYFSGAWFMLTRKAEGTLEFVEGIKIEYNGLYEEGSTPSNKNLKLAYLDGKTLKELEVNNVTSNMSFNLSAPTVKAADGTVPFYLRAKLNFQFKFKDVTGVEKTLSDATFADFIATTAGYEKNGQSFTVDSVEDLFISLPSLNKTDFVEYNGWYYLGTANIPLDATSTTFENLNLTKLFFNDEETLIVELLEKNASGNIMLQLDDEIDFGENMPFTQLKISLDIQAVEESAVSMWNS